jgi:hypothetical protein
VFRGGNSLVQQEARIGLLEKVTNVAGEMMVEACEVSDPTRPLDMQDRRREG